MHSVSPASHYQPEIQGLRAIAVMLVVFYHSGLPGLPGGYVGVDVFFVISGYLITGLLLREIGRSGGISLGGFYARRMRRLLPAASLVLLATIAVAWYAYSPLELTEFSRSALATAAYLSNLWFAHLSTDYLAENTDANPLLHTWSLAVEEQFYLVWPFLLLAVLHLGARSGFARRLLLAFCATIVVSLAGAVFLTDYNQPWAFFGSPTRAWEFAVGGLLALWLAHGRTIGPRLSIALGTLGLVMVMGAALVYSKRTPFPGWSALAPVLGAALIIAGAQTDRLRGRGVGAFLALRPMQFIGDLSYSLYLWHWPVFIFAMLWLGELSLNERLLSIAGVFVLAWLTAVLVENPVRFNRRLSARATRGLAAGAMLTAIVAAIALGVQSLAARALKEPAQQLFLDAHRRVPAVYDDGCHADFLDVEQPECLFGERNGAMTLVLFGDSHAAQWFPALRELVESRRWRLYAFTKSGCPSVDYELYNPALGRQYTECTAWRTATIERIAAIRPDSVIVTNSNRYVYGGNEAMLQQWQAATERTLAALESAASSVVLLRDTPRPYLSAPRCLSMARWRGKDPEDACVLHVIPPDQDDVWHVERDASAAIGNVRTIDLGDVICPQPPCSSLRAGQVLFRDSSHMSVPYSRTLAEPLARELLRDREIDVGSTVGDISDNETRL
ncbi:MAG: acyltransferase [Thiohalocapsa sp.]|jgi:peptidoglycan/LPS O-acetylase OafA/YrhL|nr:acyltransferase [Thiohalocapsa sp.]